MKLTEENFLRQQIRKLLREDLSWGTDDAMYGGGPELDVFNTLIMPFVDVFKVAFVAFKDITSSMLDIADYLITFDEEKMANIRERFRQRRKKYGEQYKEAMKTTDAAFSGPDAKLFMFMAAPGAMMAKGAAKLTWSAAEPVRDKVEDYFGGTLGIGDRDIAASTAADKSPGLFADLKRAFFGEGLDEIDELERVLFEQEERSVDPPTDSELLAMAEDYIEESGMAEDIKKFWDEVISDKEKETASILDEQKKKVDLLTRLSIAESMPEAEGLVSELRQLGADFSGPLEQVKQGLEKEVNRLKDDEEAASKMIEDLKGHPDAKNIPADAGIESYAALIEKGFLASAFGTVVEEGKKAGVAKLLGFVAEMTEDDLEELASLSPYGKRYADVIYKFRDNLLSL